MQKNTFRIIGTLCIFAVVFLHATSSAQVPGYIGKRFVVSSDVQLMPSVLGWLLYKDEDNFSAINYRPGLNVEYVIGRHSSVSVGFHAFNTYLSFPIQPRFSGISVSLSPERLIGVDYDISLLFYLSGLPAPLGNYIKISRIGVRAWPDYERKSIRRQVDQQYYGSSPLDYEVVKASSISPASSSVYSVEFGRQRILWNVIAFRYSGGIGIEPSNTLKLLREEYGYIEERNNDFGQKYLEEMSKRRIFSTYLFTFKLGIGYVL